MKPNIKFASIITTYRCNAKCAMCNTWQFPTKKENELTPDVYEKLPFMDMVNITGGEPFIREDLAEIIKIVQPRTKRIVISSNGYFTDRVIALFEKFPKLGIRVSIEGLPKANDELRGIKDGFDHGLRTLLTLDRMGVKDIGFGITVSDRNAKDMIELYQLAKKMGVEFATAAVHNSFYFHKMDNEIKDKQTAIHEFEKLIREMLKSKRVKDWFRAYFNHGLINYIQGKPRLLPCDMGHDSFFLDPYGEIFPCNVLEESMGNLRSSSFLDIWTSDKARVVRQKAKTCGKNCWMVGSVSQQMKKHIFVPGLWILKKKYIRSN